MHFFNLSERFIIFVERMMTDQCVQLSNQNQPLEIHPTTVTEASCIDHSILITDQASTPSHPEEITTPIANQTIPNAENSWTCQAILTSEQDLLLTQSEEIFQPMPIAENSWAGQLLNPDQDPLSTPSEEINPTMPVHENSWIAHLIINTNQAPISNQLEDTNQVIPVAEISWVNDEMVNLENLQSPVNVTEVPWGIVALVYPNQASLDQTEELESTMPRSTEPVVVSSDAAWEVHPYIRASLDSLNEPQASGLFLTVFFLN